MFGTDYRVILRRFELERLLDPPPVAPDGFGVLYSDQLLGGFYATDATKLHRTFGRLNETQQTLYAVNALCGQVANGGISQFFFNAKPLLRYAVVTALERIGATEMLREYMKIFTRVEGNEGLARVRAAAKGWDDYLEFRADLGGEVSADAAFDEWFFAGQACALDRLMRAYISDRGDDLVRICDGDTRLEARWVGKRLGRLTDDFDRYQAAHVKSQPYQFFDHLFTSSCRERFGDSREERQENARVVATRLMPSIRKATRRPKTAFYVEQPNPHITIDCRAGQNPCTFVATSFYQDQHNMEWLISEWQ